MIKEVDFLKIIVCFVTMCTIILLIVACHFPFDDVSISDKKNENGFWVRDQSYLLDYTIKDNSIQLRYSFCFQNHTGYDLRVNGFVVDLRKSDLNGWLKYENSYNGALENGDDDILILSGEKINVILVLEGEYLGGEVNTNFRVNHIVMGQRIEE